MLFLPGSLLSHISINHGNDSDSGGRNRQGRVGWSDLLLLCCCGGRGQGASFSLYHSLSYCFPVPTIPHMSLSLPHHLAYLFHYILHTFYLFVSYCVNISASHCLQGFMVLWHGGFVWFFAAWHYISLSIACLFCMYSIVCCFLCSVLLLYI